MSPARPAFLLLFLACLGACAPVSTSPPAATLPSPIASELPSLSPTASTLTFPAEPIMVTHPRTSASSFQAGISLLLYGNDVSYQREASLLFDQLATDNVNSLAFVIPIFQGGLHATDVHIDTNQTPSDKELAWLAAAAHERGFTVMLRPLIDERSIAADVPWGWRGAIWPNPVGTWFGNYTAVMLHYARFAQAHGIEVLDIGSELNSMEIYTYYWPPMIAQIRAAYSGALTYSSNFDTRPFVFGYLMNFVSVDAYYGVSSLPFPSSAQIAAGWQGNGLPDLLRRSRVAGKPVVITEVGVWPANGVFAAPFGGGRGYNPFAQQNFYEGTCAALKPSISGIYWWYVGLTQQPVTTSGHDPLSVPGTDQAIANCYAPTFTYPPPPNPLQCHHINND